MNYSIVRRRFLFSLIISAFVALGVTRPLPVEGQSTAEEVGRTPPRLSFLDGSVSFWRPGADDWSEAQVNTPMAPGDQLYAAPDSRLELQIGARAYVRAAGDSQLGLENQEPNFVQMRVAS